MSNRLPKLAGLAVLGLMAAGPAAFAEEVKADISKGAITFQSGNNSMTIGGGVQFRWTGDDREDYDADLSSPGVGKEDGFSQQFSVYRLRLFLYGGMFKPWLKYTFQYELGNTNGDKDNKIKDAVIGIEKNPLAVLKMGQFKTPFSLQELTSDGYQEFVDRAITNAKFAPGRDQGLSLNGATKDKRFGYGAGVFNGAGEGKAVDDQGLMYVARIWFDPFGEYKLAESAIDATEKSIFHVGLAARTGEAQRGNPANASKVTWFEDPDNETAYNLELAWKFKRFFATGEYFMMNDERTVPVLDPNGVPTEAFTGAPDIDSDGFHVQGGVMLVPKTMEVALRYAQIDPDKDVDKDKVTEARIVFGYYFKGHFLKLQADAGQVTYGKNYSTLSSLALNGMPSLGTRVGLDPEIPSTLKDYTDMQFRVQMQVAFW